MGAKTTTGGAIQVFNVAIDLDEQLDRLRQDRPGDDATIVDDVRFAMAWQAELVPVPVLAAEAGVKASRLAAFLAAPANAAGELLTLAEGARLARYCGERLHDQESQDEMRAMWELAEPYLEAAELKYDEAMRRARAVRREYRRGLGLRRR
jgi:hypothetical protein